MSLQGGFGYQNSFSLQLGGCSAAFAMTEMAVFLERIIELDIVKIQRTRRQAKANGSISSVKGEAEAAAARKRAEEAARGTWIEQQEAADAAFIQEMQTAPLSVPLFTTAQAAEAYQRFRAQEREGYNAMAGEQLMCKIDDAPLQEKKSIWQRIGNWMRSPSTWWGSTTEDEAVELMKRARGFPDISIPLPMLKGFGMDDVAGPLKYTIKTDTAIRTFGRVLDDFSPGILTGIGWGITVTPNLVKNVREKSPWNQTATDLLIDTVGFGISELAGWGAGLIFGGITAALGAPMAAPYVALAAKVVVDGGVSILWDSIVEKYGLRDWLSRQMEKGSQSLLQKIKDNLAQAIDNEKYPPVPTPPPAHQATGTPAAAGQNLTMPESGTPVPQTNNPIPPVPTPPPSP